MESWMKDRDGFLRLKDLQGEKTVELGWLLYSSRAMSSKLLRDAYEKALNFPFSVRWKTIRQEGQQDPDWRKRPAALHVEVDEENYFRAKAL